MTSPEGRNGNFFVMGVLNVTPDSFYDGGTYNSVDSALFHAETLYREGADIIDIGGESTRPGATTLSVQEELDRVIPVIEKISDNLDVTMSIDTTKSVVAEESVKRGVDVINDVSAGRFDENMANVAAKYGCRLVLMHSRKKPENMQNNPFYADVIEEVKHELIEAVELFVSKGCRKESIIIDPGIGFAKRFEDNLELLSSTSEFLELGFDVLIGTSRKSFIGKILDREPSDRLYGTLASMVRPFLAGARYFRVHDVRETIEFLKVLETIG